MSLLLLWGKLFAIFLLIAFGTMLGLCAIVWFCSKPNRRGPVRIVDVENRGHTRFVMPDGSDES
jgi:hypothetical protein